MHIFEYSEIAVSIPSDIVDTLLDIERIRAFDQLRIARYAKELEEAEFSCTVMNTVASNGMEGIHADEALVTALVSGKEPSDDRESVVSGYADALSDLMASSGAFHMDEASVLHLHRTVMNGTTRRESRFRYRENQEADVEHTRAIRPMVPEDVRSAFNQMCESYSMANDIGIRAALLAPCLVLDYLNIHPFPEANWRISRLILEGLLVRGGYEALAYVPVDVLVSEDEESYYDAVSESSSGWRNNTNDPFAFVRYVAETLLSVYREFELRYPLDDGRKVDKTGRIENIIRSTGSTMSKTEICRRIPDVSRRTADKVLTELVQNGKIVKTGTFKDARYRSL